MDQQALTYSEIKALCTGDERIKEKLMLENEVKKLRVLELVRLNRDDINLENRECIVYGKGDKERRVYFDAKAKVHLKEYLDSRTDDNPALFVTLNSPHKRLKISGVEIHIRELGRSVSAECIHPHKFRMVNCEYLYDNFSLERAESVRKQLRDLMQYLPNIKRYFIIDIPDKIYVDGGDPIDIQKPYAEKAMEFIANSNHPSLAKIRNLDALTDDEKAELTQVFCEKLGTEAECSTWTNGKALLPFLRMQVGIADEAIMTKFGTILNDSSLDEMQKNYLEQIVEYARKTLRSRH